MATSSQRPPNPCFARHLSAPEVVLLLAIALATWSAVRACGPFFPNSLLLMGDNAVLRAPEILFLRELDRLPLDPPPGLAHQESDLSERETTLNAEISDLRQALGAVSVPTNQVAEWVLAFSRVRADLEDLRRPIDVAEPFLDRSPDGESPASRPPPFQEPSPLPEGIPAEFQRYLHGAFAWHQGRTNEARAAWESILALPPAKRRFKSTWASFMLGRSWHEPDPARAIRFYEATRSAARKGFSDSAGLAVASLGWEAQLRLRTNDLAKATRLYLDQYAAGARQSAGSSLQVAARRVLDADPDLRRRVARDPIARRMITAWLITSTGPFDAGDLLPSETQPTMSPMHRWLDTLESIGAAEVPLAEQLALLSYRTGEWTAARRWIELSGDSPVAEWILAKLLLRDGNLHDSAEAFARVIARLPVPAPELAPGQKPEFADSLVDPHDGVSARRMVLGESGILHLTQGDFIQALDALLRSGFWLDAAYVAERVLTTGELQRYVDTHWPTASPEMARLEDTQPDSSTTTRGQRARIRHLLARRLTRESRGLEATPYYPPEWQPAHRNFLTHLGISEDVSRPGPERARHGFTAAWIARTNGLEILGTEVAPDWAVWSGDYEYGPTVESRAAQKAAHLRPTLPELKRAAIHTADPERRFHYRYQAAFLAWDAAHRLPDNDPETALMLYTAGQWLKARDPKTADLFYKALVRRCRGTELGDAADRQRWFPQLDATGKPIVTRPSHPSTAIPEATQKPDPFGDSIPEGEPDFTEEAGILEPVEIPEQPPTP